MQDKTGKRIKGPSYPQAKENGRYLAESFMPQTGRYLRTYHDLEAKAQKRLVGNPLHIYKRVIDTKPSKG
jgi:lipocalin